jgi:cbb3-type cytochrome oxidase subunit 3
MLRLSDIVGRLSASSMMVAGALLLFVLVFLSITVYAYFLLGRDTVRRFASMPLDDEHIVVPMHEVTKPADSAPVDESENG